MKLDCVNCDKEVDIETDDYVTGESLGEIWCKECIGKRVVLELDDVDNDRIEFVKREDTDLFIKITERFDEHSEAAVVLEESEAKRLLAFLKQHYGD